MKTRACSLVVLMMLALAPLGADAKPQHVKKAPKAAPTARLATPHAAAPSVVHQPARGGHQPARVAYGYGRPARRVVRHTTVVHAPSPVVHSRVVVRSAPARPVFVGGYQPSLAIGVRPSAILMSGETLRLSRFENPTMGGLGVFVRGDVSPSFGVELSFDYLTGGEAGYRQRTMPLMLSGVFALFPTGSVNPYFLAGAGVHVSQMSYEGGFVYEAWEPAGQIGGGVRVRLGDHVEVYGDVRALGVWRALGSYDRACDQMGACTPDRFNPGAQFSAGVALRF